MAFDKKLLGLAIEKQCENMLALSPKTTATKCKGYSIQGKLNFQDYFNIYTDRKTLQGTNNNMQLKKDIEEERLIMTNIPVIKNVFIATHTKYRVSKDFSTCTPLFLEDFYQFGLILFLN
jgi:hypothetical protein